MLPKKKRLNRSEFNRFFVVGRRYNTPHFQLIFTSHGSFHGAVVVGKKVYKKAVLRNRLRRQVYAVLYRSQGILPLGVYIIIARGSASTLSGKEVILEVQKLLKTVS
ncbi:ribonuclease P protein component [Candidatus Kaiserbacteria bacterium]|nr:ribonuclease P protein component [Candidatus Kaiserbacteria bacterium]